MFRSLALLSMFRVKSIFTFKSGETHTHIRELSKMQENGENNNNKRDLYTASIGEKSLGMTEKKNWNKESSFTAKRKEKKKDLTRVSCSPPHPFFLLLLKLAGKIEIPDKKRKETPSFWPSLHTTWRCWRPPDFLLCISVDGLLGSCVVN